MKLLNAISFALLLGFTACRVVPSFPQPFIVANITTLVNVFGTPLFIGNDLNYGVDPDPVSLQILETPAIAAGPTPAPSPTPQSEWQKNVCRGAKLNKACKLDKEKAIEFVNPIDSPWDGTLEAELKLWGYHEVPADMHCDFDDIASALKALRIGLLSRAEGGDNYCYQVRHWDDDARTNHRDQTYTVENKVYRMTGAHFIIGANARSGVIFFVDRMSPMQSAEYLWMPDIPTADKLPALRSSSDIAWGVWNRVNNDRNNIGNIRHFVVHNTVNHETRRLIEEALKVYDLPAGQQRATTVPKWPGLAFDIETEAGQAMLGSPNGIAAGYFLSQHKIQLGGNKYIHQVSVFAPDWNYGQPSIIFYVKDALPSTSAKKKITKKRQLSDNVAVRTLTIAASDVPSLPKENGPALGGDSPPPAKRPKVNPVSPGDPSSPTPPEAPPQTDWDRFVCRGEKLTRASKLSKERAEEFVLPIASPWGGSLRAERILWGYTETPDPDCDFEGEYYDIARAYKALKVLPESEDESESEGSNQCFRVFHYDPEKVDENGGDVATQDQTYKVNDRVYRATGAQGTFGINVEQGVVWFIDVASAALKAASVWGVPDPPVDQLPALRQMSDLAWGFWHEAHSGSNLGHITKFIVPQIINEETLSVIKQALETYTVPEGQVRVTTLPTWPGITFDIETDQGKALLGSPNGIAAAFFLSQHKEQIGSNKYVHQITVFQPDESESDSEEPSIVLYVKDAPAPMPENEKENAEEPEQSALTRREDQSFWQKYVCRGEKLTQASLRNKDTAVKFASPIDNEWDGTLENELKLWGYTDYDGQSLYCEIGNIAENLANIGVDAKFKHNVKTGQNQCFNIGHRLKSEKTPVRDQTYTVGDKTYRMTDAYSHMGVNARDGVLTFLNVRSAERGAIVTWKVEKPAVDELPKLRQISDLAWAFWKREHPDNVGLDNINKFLVHDVINPATVKLVKRALLSYKVSDGEERYKYVPKWPGLIFDIETEEGKAMLGSPNGVAAGYFLSQHKSQLGGNRYVHQATVWNDRDGDLQMMFWVKSAPPPPEDGDGDMVPTPQNDDTNTHGKVMKQSADGKNVVREHVMYVRL